MNVHSLKIEQIEKGLSTDCKNGLTRSQVDINRRKYGANELARKKRKSLFKRLIEALSEPTLIILEFAWVITVGVNIGKSLRGNGGDIYECLGILIAILISAFLTVYMEGRSEKAFELLGAVYDKISVKVIRDGKTVVIPKEEVVAGDLVIIETGDKIIADGRLVEACNLKTDESMLTGESMRAAKSVCLLPEKTSLAERRNCVYSGTFVSQGTGRMIATAVGDNAELGLIAGELGEENAVAAPLNEKLAKLGKKITIIGAISAAVAFILSLIKLSRENTLDFFSVQDAFIEAIVLIVAAVPEGLPTTAAISLSLNVLKLAKSNALIRKLVAAETVGCVSVICSDKTGTLTENDMRVERIFGEFGKNSERSILLNSAVNSAAVLKKTGNGVSVFGSATEGALLKCGIKSGVNYEKLRDKRLIGEVLPFNSDNKYMATEYFGKDGDVVYIKGAPEKVLQFTDKKGEASGILKEISDYQKYGRRVIAFAHKERRKSLGEELIGGGFTYDGYAVISDPVRRDVIESVKNCRMAGIEVKMMTGDNAVTAGAVATEIGIITSMEQVVMADEIERMSESELRRKIGKIAVIARSTPSVKLKVVEALKASGTVVAVTGDGVNDAPAIKHADIGIAMGSGSEITKEASDIVLLDDSFSTIVKAICFGRNIYRNFQRFITFQLSVNVTAMIVVIMSLTCGLDSPFNAVQLLWIDIIMDGPPALTLGLEKGGAEVLKSPPVKRTDEIVTPVMLLRIIGGGAYMATLIVCEYMFDFLNAGAELAPTVLFCMFVIFQLFNAFNCRKLTSESIFVSMGKNKLMVGVFAATFAFQILITQFLGDFFKTEKLPAVLWLKIIGVCFSVVVFSEICKFCYRFFKKGQKKVARLKVG